MTAAAANAWALALCTGGRDACKKHQTRFPPAPDINSCTLGTFVASRRLLGSCRSILQPRKLLHSKSAQVLSGTALFAQLESYIMKILPACGLRICQTYVFETVADVAETLVQPSGVAAWWMCNLGTQYIKCSIILPIQKLSFEARGGGIACLY